MTVKEIIQIENGNRNTIILLREGIFWRAYEKSAYAFSMQVHPYKPTRKWVIAVKQDVVSLGFPVSAAENVLNGCKVLMRQEARLVLAASPIDPDGFEVWKQTVPRSCLLLLSLLCLPPLRRLWSRPLHLPLHPLFHPPFLPSDSVATGLRTASVVLTSRAKLPWTACCSLWN